LTKIHSWLDSEHKSHS